MQTDHLDPFGVAFSDVDPEGSFDTIEEALSQHGVVVLRDLTLSDDAFVALLERLGPMTFTQGEQPLAHQPALNFVSNIGRTTPPRSVFHTDTSYVARRRPIRR